MPGLVDREASPLKHAGTVVVMMYELWARRRLAAVLNEAGYEVVEASNGATGVRLAELYRPDAIVLSGGLRELNAELVVEHLPLSPTHSNHPGHSSRQRRRCGRTPAASLTCDSSARFC
jgi:CheY-like chemotaxis protein